MRKQDGNPGDHGRRKSDPVGHRLLQAQLRLDEVFCQMGSGRLQKVRRGGRGSEAYVTTVKTANRRRGGPENHEGKNLFAA